MPRLAQYRNPEKGWGVWQVNDKNAGEFIGWILIRPMYFFTDAPAWHDIEIGWRFKQRTWGQGFATEAAKHIMQTLTISQDIGYFSAIVDADNLASIGVMKKLGMDYLKTDTHPDVADATVEFYQVKV
ncbi:GNAT family N-acetyltransferase [Thalassotalea maritima]|uniref:GNAT family N-acetyltransferase n=1 Tax=Thalassotalea maritima TaxID=3242416 RepID=UPI0035286D7F